MDPNIIGNLITLFIDAHFPGGTAEFTEQGGIASYSPGHVKDAVVIWHPDLPDSFLDDIEHHNQISSIQIVISNGYNFMNMSRSQIIDMLSGVVEGICKKYNVKNMVFNPMNPLVFFATIPDMTLDQTVIDMIVKDLSDNIPEVIRGVLYVNNRHHIFGSQEQYVRKTKKRVQLEEARGNITEDTLTDLKILLSNDCDVNDFINNL